jgi:D-alanyl-lipoteichoic acid acyltransferase DltB (MBOAT superfamily)
MTSSWIYPVLIFLAGGVNLLLWVKKERLVFIALLNVAIYALLAADLLPALFLYCGLTYFFALLIRDEKVKNAGVISVVLFLLISLALFIVGKVWGDLQLNKRLSVQIFIPLGFSYICLQNLGFILDTRNKKNLDFPNLLEFFASSMFFANITSGPIADLYEVKREYTLWNFKDSQWLFQKDHRGFGRGQPYISWRRPFRDGPETLSHSWFTS